ncbi:MAG: pyridoxal phosphate-dependent aminotransferase [Bacteroidota bacterium]|nr:pyridoxal phosphate-dependent aminotransferase [Bacteroidota bacterium]MDP4230963.1 pyridoxal phosphate-dependent aminotransferase [Bacteroidota bacterium]MDP4235168.1 pyridoxal phosphate-dependent aminotransferase [Bacteroidota bacterium]
MILTEIERRLAKRMENCEEAATLKIAARASLLRSQGKQIVSLSTGEPDFPTPENIKLAAIRAIEQNFTKYTSAEGMPELRDLVAQKFKHDDGVESSAERVLITSGGKHALSNALFVLCEAGDEIIIPSPFWLSYSAMAGLSEATAVLVETKEEEDWLLTPERLENAITPASRLLLLNTPHNPTSTIYSEAHLRALVPLIEEHELIVVVDELYEKLTYDGRKHFSLASIPEIAEQVVTVNGLSKAYAMTGWRLGYATGPEWIISAMGRLQSQAVSHPSSISQKAAIEALTGPQESVEIMRTEFQKRRDIVVSLLKEIPNISFSTPKAAFYVFFSIASFIGKKLPSGKIVKSGEDICEMLLEDHGLALVPGNAFGKPDAIRLSFAASESDIRKGVAILKSALGMIS